MKKIVIFASGSGTNAENIIKFFNFSSSAAVVSVFTNNPNALIIEKAKLLKVPVEVFSKENLNEGIVLRILNTIQPDLIVLAGFLLKFPKEIIQKFPNKVINIHPALLPKYGGKGMYGMNIHNAVIENKEQETGITIHYVNENYDEGAIIFQEIVSVTDCVFANEVAAKIHELEQKYFPIVIEQLINQST